MNVMEFFQGLSFVFMGLTVAMYYTVASYRKKKQSEYGNDERWKSIVAAATMAVYRYHAVVLVLVVLGNAVYRMFIANYLGIDVQVRMNDVFMLLYFVLLGASAVELIAFRIYDKKM